MPSNVKILKNGAILVEVEKDADTLLKRKKFHEIKIKAYSYKTFEHLKGE